jgi:hypothetical protein
MGRVCRDWSKYTGEMHRLTVLAVKVATRVNTNDAKRALRALRLLMRRRREARVRGGQGREARAFYALKLYMCGLSDGAGARDARPDRSKGAMSWLFRLDRYGYVFPHR